MRAFEHQMDVIGHEAIGKNCEVLVLTGAQQLLPREVDDQSRLEQAGAIGRRKTQVISMESDVVEPREPRRATAEHRGAWGNRCAVVFARKAKALRHE
jgi:hypothetical protein